MKTTVSRQEFVDVLTKVSTVIPSRHMVTMATGVLLEVEDNRLKLTGTNLEAIITGYCDAETHEVGSVVLNPRPLLNFLAIGGETVTISEALRECHIETGSGKLTMLVTKGRKDDFPPAPKVKGVSLILNGLRQAIDDVEKAQALEDSRPVISGIAIVPRVDGVELVAADGFRLVVSILISESDITLPKLIVVPRQTVALLKVLEIEEAVLTVDEGSGYRYASFESNGLTVITSLTQGTYPKYNGLIPNSLAHHLQVDATKLESAIKACGNYPNGIVRLQTIDGMLTVRAHDEDDNEVGVKVPSQGEIKVAANPRYLLDMLSRLTGEIILSSNETSSPFMVKTDRLTYVVMPMFVQWES